MSAPPAARVSPAETNNAEERECREARRARFSRECCERIDTMDSQEIYEQIMMIMRLRVSRQPMSQRRVLMRALAHGVPVTVHATPQEEPTVTGSQEVTQAAARVPSSVILNMLQQAAGTPPRRPLPMTPMEVARRLEMDMRGAGISPFSAPFSGFPGPRMPRAQGTPPWRPRILRPVRPPMPPGQQPRPSPPSTSSARWPPSPPPKTDTSPQGLPVDHIPLPPEDDGEGYRGDQERGVGSTASSTSSSTSGDSR